MIQAIPFDPDSPYCEADLPFISGADPNCPTCEGYGSDPEAWANEQSAICPTCMVDQEFRPLEQYTSWTDWDNDHILDNVTFMRAKYYGGTIRLAAVDTIVLHQGVSGRSVAEYFMHPGGRCVSAHFEVQDDGTVIQCVPLNHAAWHAPPFNFRSWGIEMQGPWGKEWKRPQVQGCYDLCQSLIAIGGVKAIRPHCSISKNRKDVGSPKHPWPWDYFDDLGVKLITKRAA